MEGARCGQVFFFTLEREATLDVIGPQTLRFARALNQRLPDEKGPEDVHQHVRDVTRGRRHKHVKMATVYDAQIRSGVLEARKVPSPQVPPQLISKEAWRSLAHKQRSRASFVARPVEWPDEFNTVLNPRRDWPSPTVPGQAQSWLAWHWLRDVARQPGDDPTPPHLAWASRLAPKHALLVHSETQASYLTLFVGRWGLIAHQLRPGDGHTWSVSCTPDAIRSVYVCDARDFMVVPKTTSPREDVGVVLQQDGEGVNLFQSALCGRRDFTKWGNSCRLWRLLTTAGTHTRTRH